MVDNGSAVEGTIMNRRTKIIFWGMIALLLVGSSLAIYFIPKNGNTVVISRDGEEIGCYSLEKDQVLRFEEDEDYNIVEIKDGVVRVTEASCKNQICVHSASISKEKPGMIVCLPNKLIVEIQE